MTISPRPTAPRSSPPDAIPTRKAGRRRAVREGTRGRGHPRSAAALPPLDLEPAPEPLVAPVIRPHAPLAGRVNLANGHAFAPPFRPGPPPPTQSLEGRILAQLAERPGSPRGLASILDIKETFVAQTLRNLAREGRVSADALAPGVGDRDQAWRRA